MNSKRFLHKVALVTGSSSGIGRATAIAFAGEGAKVIVASRRQTQGEATVRMIEETGSVGRLVQTDAGKSGFEIRVRPVLPKSGADLQEWRLTPNPETVHKTDSKERKTAIANLNEQR